MRLLAFIACLLVIAVVHEADYQEKKQPKYDPKPQLVAACERYLADNR